jgi:endonuclease/exonuclease/phosphatase family metal-dependent hydrolase
MLGAALLIGACTSPVTVATFNIRVFPEPSTDRGLVAQRVAQTNASTIAVQEIADAAAFEAMLADASARSGRDYKLVLGACLGPRRLTTGVVYDANAWHLEHFEHYKQLRKGESTCGDEMPGTLAVLDDGSRRLAVLSVHLQPFPIGFDRRRSQWSRVLTILSEVREAWAPDAILAMGDYNSTGFSSEPKAERPFVERLLQDSPYALATHALPCSEYWQPKARRGPYQPSILDHIVVAGGTWETPQATQMCERLECQRVAYEEMDRDYDRVSDHCPVVMRGRL